MFKNLKIFKQNKFIIFYVFNILLLVFLLIFSVPFSKYLSQIGSVKVNDNEFVKNQNIINPDAKSPKIIDRKILVNLEAEISGPLNWSFKSLEKSIEIKIGENTIVNFEGKNLSNKTITASAIFSADPEIILPYLIKTECFCFNEQELKPGETQLFSMVFFLDPSLDLDANLDNLKNISFKYILSENI